MSVRSELGAGQARLLRRHRTGLVRVAQVLARKRGRVTTEIMFLLAHQDSRLGSQVREQLGASVIRGREAVVVPGAAEDLARWLERLALGGAIVDCAGNESGVPVIVIDKTDAMAFCRLASVNAAGNIAAQNRCEIPPA